MDDCEINEHLAPWRQFVSATGSRTLINSSEQNDSPYLGDMEEAGGLDGAVGGWGGGGVSKFLTFFPSHSVIDCPPVFVMS